MSVAVNFDSLHIPVLYDPESLSSTRVVDTLGHTVTPSSSVDSKLLRFFPGHADVLQVVLHGIYPILSRSFWLSLCIA